MKAKAGQPSYPLVYIEWEDSQVGTQGGELIDGVQPKLSTMRSVGWLVYNGKDCKLIVPHLSESGNETVKQQGCGDMTIPASAVRKMVKVELKKR